MLSDAPAHHLFALMSPVKEDQSSVPEVIHSMSLKLFLAVQRIFQVLALAQVCLEGNLSKETVSGAIGSGKRAAGDLLPWTISQQFMVQTRILCFLLHILISNSLGPRLSSIVRWKSR